LGLLALLRLSYLFITFVYTYFVLVEPKLKTYGAGSGAWAVVTGASDGIGKGFAQVLAKYKFNVVLISRTESKLNELAKELESTHGVQTRVVSVDVGDANQMTANLEKITSVISSLDKVTILVNNVGVNNAGEVPLPLEEQQEEDIVRIINVNVVFTTRITKRLLPFLRKNKDSRSAIINLSSIAQTFSSSPFLATYAATKAYDAVLAQGLAVELKSQGVDVLAVSPGYVVSNMTRIRRTSFFVTAPQTTAKSALAKLGSYHHELTPDFSHALMRFGLNLLPSPVADHFILQGMNDVKKRLLQKREKKSE